MELDFHQIDERYKSLRLRNPSYERRLLASLAALGQRVPVVVVADSEASDRFVLIDGFKRVRSLQRLHRDTVEATSLNMSETDALLFVRTLCQSRGDCALEQGWLLQMLQDRFAWSLEEAGLRLDKSESWISRRLALVRELPDGIQDSVRRGVICPHTAMKYLVPLARANPGECLQLAAIAAKHKLSSRQVGEIYKGWRNSRGDARTRILLDPMLFLRSQEAAKVDKENPDTRGIEDVLRDVSILAATARRLQQWLAAVGVLEGTATSDVEQVSLATSLAIHTLAQLQAACAQREAIASAS